jgi:hypothetical protein
MNLMDCRPDNFCESTATLIDMKSHSPRPSKLTDVN